MSVLGSQVFGQALMDSCGLRSKGLEENGGLKWMACFFVDLKRNGLEAIGGLKQKCYFDGGLKKEQAGRIW